MGGRLARIDVLRGVAFLLVLGRHIPMQVLDTNNPALLALCVIKRIGWIGVDLFFVLSGFLVSGLLFREYLERGRVRLGRFFARRAVRIYVPFYVFLVLSLPLVLQRVLEVPSRLATEAIFTQSYWLPALWTHTWSLAVEEHFYALLGALTFLILLEKRRGRAPFGSFILLWAGLAVLCPFLRVMSPYSDIRTFINSHLRFDALLFGVFLSYYYHFHHDSFLGTVRRFRYLIAAVSIFCLLPVFFLEVRTEPWMTRFGLTFLYVGFGGLLALCLTGPRQEEKKRPPNRLLRTVAGIGRSSYSLYLWHVPANVVVDLLGWPQTSALRIWLNIAFYLVLTFLAGYLAHQWVEKPSLAWRDRTFPA